MNPQRPHFDDEELPAWLTAAGITHARRPPSGTLSAPTAAEPAGGELADLFVEDEEPRFAPLSAESPEGKMELPAIQAATPPWMQTDSGSFAFQPDTPIPQGWQTDTPGQPAEQPRTGPLPWMSDSPDSADEAAAHPYGLPDNSLDDLFAETRPEPPTAPPVHSEAVPPAEQPLTPEKKSIRSLKSGDSGPLPPSERPILKKLSQTGPKFEAPPEPPPPDATGSAEDFVPDWVSDVDLPLPPSAHEAPHDTALTTAPKSQEEPVNLNALPIFRDEHSLLPLQGDTFISRSPSTEDDADLPEWMREPLPDVSDEQPRSGHYFDEAAEQVKVRDAGWLSEEPKVGFTPESRPTPLASLAPQPSSVKPSYDPQSSDIDFDAAPDWVNSLDPSLDLSEVPASPAASGVPSEPALSLEESGINLDELMKSGGDVDIDSLLSLSEPEVRVHDFDFPTEATAPKSNLLNLAANDVDLDDMDLLVAAPLPGTPPRPEDIEEPDVETFMSGDRHAQTTGLLSKKDSVIAPLPRADQNRDTSPSPPFQADAQSLLDYGLNPQELPDWVSDMRPDEPIQLAIGDQVLSVKEAPVSRLPSELREIRDLHKGFRPEAGKTVAPLEGPLAGITGAINPVGTATPMEPLPAYPFGGPTSNQTMHRVKLLQKLLAAEEEILAKRQKMIQETDFAAEDAPTAKRRAWRLSIKPDRLLITAVLVAAILLPFLTTVGGFTPSLDSAMTAASAPGSRFDRMQQAINTVQPDQWVLVAFEYAPTAAAEMDEMAKVLLLDLFKRNARPVIVSGNPAGVLHAYGLLDRLSRDTQTLTELGVPIPANRQDYIVLRYLPGGSIGLRALIGTGADTGPESPFATDIEGQSTGLSAEQFQGMLAAPVFLLTESGDDIRLWAEQYRGSITQQSPLRIALMSSVGASATAQAYVATAGAQFVSVLIGTREAAVYRRLRGLDTVTSKRYAEQRWQSAALAGLVAAAIIALGSVLNLLGGGIRRRRNR